MLKMDVFGFDLTYCLNMFIFFSLNFQIWSTKHKWFLFAYYNIDIQTNIDKKKKRKGIDWASRESQDSSQNW